MEENENDAGNVLNKCVLPTLFPPFVTHRVHPHYGAKSLTRMMK